MVEAAEAGVDKQRVHVKGVPAGGIQQQGVDLQSDAMVLLAPSTRKLVGNAGKRLHKAEEQVLGLLQAVAAKLPLDRLEGRPDLRVGAATRMMQSGHQAGHVQLQPAEVDLVVGNQERRMAAHSLDWAG